LFELSIMDLLYPYHSQFLAADHNHSTYENNVLSQYDKHYYLHDSDIGENINGIEFVPVDDKMITNDMKCQLTGEILVQPIITKCNHRFESLQLHLALWPKEECPCCKTDLSNSDSTLTDDQLMKKMKDIEFRVKEVDDITRVIQVIQDFLSSKKIHTPEDEKLIESLEKVLKNTYDPILTYEIIISLFL